MRNPLESAAYEKYITPVHGVKLSDYMDIHFLEDLAESFGRQLTVAELSEFVDFELGESGPRMYTCVACEKQFPAVWWKEPTKEFLRGLAKLKDLDKCLQNYPIPNFGVHFMDDNNLLAPPKSLCGSIFRDTKKQSCVLDYQDWRLESQQSEMFGKRMKSIIKEQQGLREKKEKYAHEKGLKEARKNEREHQEVLRRAELLQIEEEQRQKERDKKLAEALKKAAKEKEKKGAVFATLAA